MLAGMVLPLFNFTSPVIQVLNKRGSAVNFARVAPSASALRACVDMIKSNTHAAIVMDGDRFTGIVTERDFVKKLKLEKGQSRATLVSDLMTSADMIKSVKGTNTFLQCVDTMRRAKVRTLPVVEKGEVKAVITMSDIAAEISATLKKPGNAPLDATVGDILDSPRVITPGGKGVSANVADSVADAIRQMRRESSGSLLVISEGATVGMFTERDYVRNVLPYDERDPADIEIREVCAFTSSSAPLGGMHDIVDPVERSTPVLSALSLMLAQVGYIP